MAIGTLGQSKVPVKSLTQIGYSEEDLILDSGGLTEIGEAIYIGPERVRPTKSSGLKPKRPGGLDHVIFLFRRNKKDLIVRAYSLYDESGNLKLEPQGVPVTYEKGFKKPGTWWKFTDDYIKSFTILGKPVERTLGTFFDEDVIPEDQNYIAPKYYNINLNVVPSSDVGIILDDYTYRGNSLTIALLEDLNRYIESSQFKTNYSLPNTSSSKDGLRGINFHFDYNKISESNEQANKDKLIKDIKTAVENALKGSTTKKEGADNPPSFKLSLDEKADDQLAVSLTPDFKEESNGGAWRLSYDIVKAPSPTQSTPPVPTVPPEETPTSLQDEVPSDTPPQDPPPPDESATSQPTEDEQAEDEQQTPTETDEQEQSREETGQSSDNTKPVDNSIEKTKFLREVFTNQKKPKQIKFDLPPDDSYQKEFVESLGNLPFLWYNAIQIEYNNIMNLELSYSDNIPVINVKFRDTLGKMKDTGIPLDDSRISLFINPRSSMLKPIHMDFKIVEFQEKSNMYEIMGALDIKELYIKKFQSYSRLTSYELYSKIAKDIGLGFATNIDNTDDRMTWINTGNRLIYFINDSIKFAYKSDETFLINYIDFYYRICYMDVEKELRRDISKELGIANTGIEEIIKSNEREKVERNFLTNDFSAKNSNYYFENYTILNNSTKLSIRKGYSTIVKYYDELIKHFIEFDVDPITSDPNSKILLRGAPQDDLFFKENINFTYMGRMDEDNMHKNYLYAPIQNKINFIELDKIGLVVELPTPNFNFYKFQKIYLALSNQSDKISKSQINTRLTGEWLIADISFKFVGNKLRQNINLVRRDLDLSPKEIEEEKTTPPVDKKSEEGAQQNNENPVDQEPQLTSEPESPGPTAAVTPVTGATSSEIPPIPEKAPEPPIEETFSLTKEMWRAIYNGKINPKVIEKYYIPMITLLKKNNITTNDEIAKVLSYINIESNFLTFVEEDINWFKYYKNSESYVPDTTQFKKRGLIKIQGQEEYRAAGQIIGKDLVANPTSIASDNQTHLNGSETDEQVENSIAVSIWYFKNKTTGDLNTLELLSKIPRETYITEYKRILQFLG